MPTNLIEGGHYVGPYAHDRMQRIAESEHPTTLNLRISNDIAGKLIQTAEETSSSLSEAFYDVVHEPALELALKNLKKSDEKSHYFLSREETIGKLDTFHGQASLLML
jgi:hypothetical protein